MENLLAAKAAINSIIKDCTKSNPILIKLINVRIKDNQIEITFIFPMVSVRNEIVKRVNAWKENGNYKIAIGFLGS